MFQIFRKGSRGYSQSQAEYDSMSRYCKTKKKANNMLGCVNKRTNHKMQEKNPSAIHSRGESSAEIL